MPRPITPISSTRLTAQPSFIDARDRSGFPTPPPDGAAGEEKNRGEQDEERKAQCIDSGLRELELAVHRGPWLNRDQVLVLRQPVERVHAEVQIAAITQEGIGQKAAAADERNPLILVLHFALGRNGDSDRPWDVAPLVEPWLLDVVDFQPAALCNIDQPRSAPLAVVLLQFNPAIEWEHRVQREILGDGMHAIAQS